jgi:hypothetical protein
MTRILLGIATVGLFLLTAPLAAAAPVHAYRLPGGVTCTVGDDGSVVLAPATGGGPPLLTLWRDLPADVRAIAEPDVFTATAREGDAGGRRGFSAHADDDDDGAVDEDRLDGLDNDGDGAVDEDFAAISDAMVAWRRTDGAGVHHLETWRWSYPHLAPMVAAVFSSEGGAAAPLKVRLEDGRWERLQDLCPTAADGMHAPAYLSRVADHWVTLLILDASPRRRAGERVHASAHRLDIPLLDHRQTVVLTVGPTRAGVVRATETAQALHRGATDPVTGRRVPWVAPPLPARVPADRLPVATLQIRDDGGFELILDHTAATDAALDPDLFVIGDRTLGAPDRLAWTDAAGDMTELAWPLPDSVDADLCHPWRHLGVSGVGAVTMHFTGEAPVAADDADPTLVATMLDGRHAMLPLTVIAVSPREFSNTGDLQNDAVTRLQLSGNLLGNYPNPFRSTTQVSFKIPETAGEAFLWERDDAPPFDPEMRLPFAAAASVDVSVYSLEGREVARLFSGIAAAGEYSASWDGRDQMGRTVASGAYFCKLQIENWSVTKRLIFIR